VRRAADDGCDVFSISWGADEANWGQQAAQDMDDAAAYAALKGMVVFAAAGDNDSSDGGPTPANVDVPASCPHVIGCGGTRKLKGVGEKAGDETVWNDNPGNAYGTGTGGGYSTFFPMPPWQAGAPHGPGRMVPDVAANADPVTGYEIVLYGKVQAIGGTSAVAPLYAGLFGAFGPGLGFVTPVLWLNHLCFNDIPDGDNGQFRARIGPDPCTGIGSPIGRKLDDLFVNNAATAARFATRQLQAKLSQALAENERYRDLLARQASTRTAAAAAPCGDYGALEPNTNVIGGPDLVRGRYHSYARGGPCPRIAPGGPGGSCIEYSYDPGTGECTKWRYVPCP
jgi:hypothetical protein